jgi:hypothetical protein
VLPRIPTLSLLGAISLIGVAFPTISSSGQLNLHNDRWDAVQVEVRIGASQDCDSNAVAGIRTLKGGNVWAIVVDQRVCWRREANPGDGSGLWTLWASRALLVDAVEDVSL